MLLQPRNSSSKVLGGGDNDKGLLKPESHRKPSKKMCPKTQAVLGCTSSANAIPRRQRHIPGRCLPQAR